MKTIHTKDAWKCLMDKVYDEVKEVGIDPKEDEYTVYQPYGEDGTLTFSIVEEDDGERTLKQVISDNILFLPPIEAHLSLYTSDDPNDARTVLDMQDEIGRMFMAANDLAVEKGFDMPNEDFTCVQPYKDNQAITVVLDGEGENRGIRYVVNDTTVVLPPINQVLHVYAR